MSRRSLRAFVYRDNDPFAFQQMTETDNRALFVFDVMVERRLDICMPERFAGGD